MYGTLSGVLATDVALERRLSGRLLGAGIALRPDRPQCNAIALDEPECAIIRHARSSRTAILGRR